MKTMKLTNATYIMKRFYLGLFGLLMAVLVAVNILPSAVFAAGISPSGGGSYTVGNTFTVNVVASGASFDAFHGVIAVSGPVSIVSFSQGTAIWANSPANNQAFDGALSSATTSFTIARVTLKGTSVGTGSVSVSSVRLVRNGVQIGTDGGSAKFTITRAPTPPGGVTITSSTNPDQGQAYGATTVQLAWTAPTNGATGYSVVFDQVKDTVPGTTVTTTDVKASFSDLNLGTYYFHIRAQNGDGWGPTTSYQINVGRSVDGGLHAPSITAVTKTNSYKTDIAAGTVTGFSISGTSTGLSGYTATLALAPVASIPAAQKLDTIIGADGSWSILFDQAIPVGFYQATVQATKDKTTTGASQPVPIELSVANGGTVKLITNNDLPQPDLTVKVAGIVFTDKAHLHRAELLVAGIAIGTALIVVLLIWLGMILVRRFKGRNGSRKDKIEPKKEADDKTPKPRVM